MKTRYVNESLKVNIDFPENESVEDHGFEFVDSPKRRLHVNDNLQYGESEGDCSICVESFSDEVIIFSYLLST